MEKLPELPRSSRYRTRPNDPLSDAERDDLTARLNAEYAEGRIEVEDFRTLLDQVFAAKTLGEVAGVVAALPRQDSAAVPSVIETGTTAPGELAPAKELSKKGPIRAAAGMISGIVALLLLVVLIFA